MQSFACIANVEPSTARRPRWGDDQTSYYLDGLKTPGAVMIQPAAYIHALAAACQPVADIYELPPVVGARAGRLWVA